MKLPGHLLALGIVLMHMPALTLADRVVVIDEDFEGLDLHQINFTIDFAFNINSHPVINMFAVSLSMPGQHAVPGGRGATYDAPDGWTVDRQGSTSSWPYVAAQEGVYGKGGDKVNPFIGWAFVDTETWINYCDSMTQNGDTVTANFTFNDDVFLIVEDYAYEKAKCRSARDGSAFGTVSSRTVAVLDADLWFGASLNMTYLPNDQTPTAIIVLEALDVMFCSNRAPLRGKLCTSVIGAPDVFDFEYELTYLSLWGYRSPGWPTYRCINNSSFPSSQYGSVYVETTTGTSSKIELATLITVNVGSDDDIATEAVQRVHRFAAPFSDFRVCWEAWDASVYGFWAIDDIVLARTDTSTTTESKLTVTDGGVTVKPSTPFATTDSSLPTSSVGRSETINNILTPSVPVALDSQSNSNSDNDSVLIVIIAGGVCAVLLLTIVTYRFFWKRSSLKPPTSSQVVLNPVYVSPYFDISPVPGVSESDGYRHLSMQMNPHPVGYNSLDEHAPVSGYRHLMTSNDNRGSSYTHLSSHSSRPDTLKQHSGLPPTTVAPSGILSQSGGRDYDQPMGDGTEDDQPMSPGTEYDQPMSEVTEYDQPMSEGANYDQPKKGPQCSKNCDQSWPLIDEPASRGHQKGTPRSQYSLVPSRSDSRKESKTEPSLSDHPAYHGRMGGPEATHALLLAPAAEPGLYLLRDSASSGLVLSVIARDGSNVHHHVLSRDEIGFLTVNGRTTPYENINELLDFWSKTVFHQSKLQEPLPLQPAASSA